MHLSITYVNIAITNKYNIHTWYAYQFSLQTVNTQVRADNNKKMEEVNNVVSIHY